ncbi:PLD nuclease N-terminal domain-containing protein [Gracilibacillus phocaeensis]|uniref:PLD nuclease N-terminal domain-containing protein n=1 Tax=Gracilibacillus phocaeensis TaxID=2042304 RepID=UPI0010306762|nr:PLD nuclease N-terminal domain-containing protein [Gracilibacillus phocaeensis]
MNDQTIQELIQILAPFIIIQFILMVIALFAWFKARQNNMLKGNEWVWLIVIILLNVIGPILFFIFGRRQD